MSTPDRFFYHSFPRPRRKGGDGQLKGLKILEAIVDFGLVLAPEATQWEYPHANRSPARRMEIAQRRVCFTELEPAELPEHARVFGPFALEFDVETLKSFFAMPVFYVPRGEGDRASIGETLVLQVADAMSLIDRIAKVKAVVDTTSTPDGRLLVRSGFIGGSQKDASLSVEETRLALDSLTHGVTPPEMLALALEGVMNFFYPADADNRFEDRELKYYRQREWRIAGNVGRLGQDMMGVLSPAFAARLIEIDEDFWSQTFPTPAAGFTNVSLDLRAGLGNRVVDWAYGFQGIDERHIIGAARRVIVPCAALELAERIIAKHPTPPSVVAIEDLAG